MSSIARKICLLGDYGVGKTSLVRRFVDRQFSDQYLSTVGVKISRKSVTVLSQPVFSQPALGDNSPASATMQLLIWDIEGSNSFKSIAQSYLQGAGAAIVVADVTHLASLQGVAEHAHRFQAVNPQGVIAIALNKTDLIDTERQAQLLKSSALPVELNVLDFYLTSAKTGDNVDVIFQNLAQSLIH